MKSLSQKTFSTLEKLAELLDAEHGQCGQHTCDISTCMEHGFTMWAVYLFDSCGAASDKFSRLYATLPKDFYKHARKEADLFCETVPHDTCPHCGAVVWDIDSFGEKIFCDSCAKDFERSTLVEFRKYRKGGDILALFPELEGDSIGGIMSYEHVGQHGAADYKHCKRITVRASPEEYADLKRELESIGYRLKIKESGK